MDTAHERAEAALRRDATLEAVAFAAQRLLLDADWGALLPQVLRRLGEATEVSRVYLYENFTVGDELRTRLRGQWVVADDVQVVGVGTELGFEGLERWVDQLGRGDVVQGIVDELPPPERPSLTRHGVRSVLLAPVEIDGGWWGYIGFDDCVNDRAWSQIEIDALRAAAGTLAAAIERERADAGLREAEARYRAIVEHIPAVAYRERFEGSGDFYISPQVGAILGHPVREWEEAETFWADHIHPDDRDRVLDRDSRTDETGEPFAMEYRFQRADGSYAWIQDEARLVERADGQRFWQGFLLDVTERKEAEARLEHALEVEREAARRLRALDEMKNTFLQAVSHDLRTPLAAILGLAITLERSDIELPPEDTQDLARRIASNARKLDRMVTDLLDLDRLARGIVEPRRYPTDVGALVARVVEGTDLMAQGRVHLDAPEIVVLIDAAKVERIVENLLANTLRHTAPGTPVTVRVEPSDGGVLLVVEDEGPGVAEEMREAIFEPFRQGTEAPEHSPGVGVGLTLVRRFAELHGGRAWVEERAGGGASFRVFLPGGSS